MDIASIVAPPANPGDPTNIEILLRSSTIQATITAQMLDLADSGTLVVPYWQEGALANGYTTAYAVRLTVGSGVTETVYLTKQEITDLVEALDVLGLTEDINTFDGGVDIGSVMSSPANIAIVLESSTLQATIS